MRKVLDMIGINKKARPVGRAVVRQPRGAEALAVFEPDKFDVVFTDFFMPGMTGGKLVAEIKARAPGQPVVLLTGYPEKFQTSGARLLDIDFMLGKPFEIETLRQAVARFSPAQPAG